MGDMLRFDAEHAAFIAGMAERGVRIARSTEL